MYDVDKYSKLSKNELSELIDEAKESKSDMKNSYYSNST